MKKLSLNNDPLHPKLLYHLNTFVCEAGHRMNQSQAVVMNMDTKIKEVHELYAKKQYLQIRKKVNEILDEVSGWGDSSSLDPMID